MKLLLGLSLLASSGMAVAQISPVAPVPFAVTVDSDAILSSVLLERIGKGETTAEKAWQSGELDEAMLLFLLNQPSGDRKGESLLNKAEQSAAFVEVLLSHLPDKVSAKNVGKLGAGARYRVADYWFKRNDERALPLLQGLVEAGAAQFKAQGRLAWFYEPSVTRVGEWYQANGRGQQGLELLDGAAKLSNNPSYRADWLVLSARMATKMGDGEKARGYYQQVAQWGQGWFSGLAIYDRARWFIDHDQLQQSLNLLNTPVKGSGADQIQISLLSLQGLANYKLGNYKEAHRYAQQAITQAAAMKLRQGMGSEADLEVAQSVVDWTNQWDKTPIVIDQGQIQVVLSGQALGDKPVTRRTLVLSSQDVPLTATVNNPHIKVTISDTPQKGDYFVQREIVIEVAPQLITQSLDAVLTVGSPHFPQAQERLPIHIEVPKPVSLSASTVFFGEVKANAPTTQTLMLSAASPFRVVTVKTDGATLEVQSPATQPAKEQTLTLTFTPPQVGRFYSGTVRIQTDVPNQEVIEVPYIARAQ